MDSFMGIVGGAFYAFAMAWLMNFDPARLGGLHSKVKRDE